MRGKNRSRSKETRKPGVKQGRFVPCGWPGGHSSKKPGENGRMAKRARRKTDAASRHNGIYAFKPGANAFKSF